MQDVPLVFRFLFLQCPVQLFIAHLLVVVAPGIAVLLLGGTHVEDALVDGIPVA